jgi:PncC family amidohydrolase
MRSVEQAVDFLARNNLVMTTAESATAGLIASLVADIPGCAAVFDSGFVVYSVAAKKSQLGVDSKTIDRFGLTSEEVAREMACGALVRSGATIALANTGMASADSELDGVMCFACAMEVAGQIAAVSETVKFEGERNRVRTAAARHALLHLPDYYDRLKSPEQRARNEGVSAEQVRKTNDV